MQHLLHGDAQCMHNLSCRHLLLPELDMLCLDAQMGWKTTFGSSENIALIKILSLLVLSPVIFSIQITRRFDRITKNIQCIITIYCLL